MLTLFCLTRTIVVHTYGGLQTWSHRTNSALVNFYYCSKQLAPGWKTNWPPPRPLIAVMWRHVSGVVLGLFGDRPPPSPSLPACFGQSSGVWPPHTSPRGITICTREYSPRGPDHSGLASNPRFSNAYFNPRNNREIRLSFHSSTSSLTHPTPQPLPIQTCTQHPLPFFYILKQTIPLSFRLIEVGKKIRNH